MSVTEEDVSWPAHALEAVDQLNASIPQEWQLPQTLLEKYPEGSDVRPIAAESGILTERELGITDPSQDAAAIVERLARGEYTAVEVLTAFSKRAALAQQTLSCLTEFFYEEALEEAKRLDQYYAEHKKPIGPLHGLPISVKSHYNLKGHISTAGFSTLVKAEVTAHSLEILKDAGAVFYCKTNLPQAIMHLESQSFWGVTRNPLNTSLSPGGSSGGCSALMAFGGSPMSMGSDIGGSLRQPASTTGLWTLKPTTLRLPRARMHAINPGFDTVVGVVGPQCRSLRDIDLCFRVLLEHQPWLVEHSLLPLPWQQYLEPVWRGTGGKIRVGFMQDDGVVTPHPPIIKALRLLRNKLKSSPDFEVVDYQAYKHKEGGDLITALYFPDGGKRVRQMAEKSNEPLLPLTKFAIEHPAVRERTIHELWELNAQREAFRAEYQTHWNNYNLDVLICPVAPQTAPRLGTSKYWAYTSIFNLVDYPGASFPTGLIVDDLAPSRSDETFVPKSEFDTAVQSLYTAEQYQNVPVCLQAIGRKYEDERLLRTLEKIAQFLPLTAIDH